MLARRTTGAREGKDVKKVQEQGFVPLKSLAEQSPIKSEHERKSMEQHRGLRRRGRRARRTSNHFSFSDFDLQQRQGTEQRQRRRYQPLARAPRRWPLLYGGRERIVGWYSSGPKLKKNDIDIYSLFCPYHAAESVSESCGSVQGVLRLAQIRDYLEPVLAEK